MRKWSLLGVIVVEIIIMLLSNTDIILRQLFDYQYGVYWISPLLNIVSVIRALLMVYVIYQYRSEISSFMKELTSKKFIKYLLLFAFIGGISFATSIFLASRASNGIDTLMKFHSYKFNSFKLFFDSIINVLISIFSYITYGLILMETYEYLRSKGKHYEYLSILLFVVFSMHLYSVGFWVIGLYTIFFTSIAFVIYKFTRNPMIYPSYQIINHLVYILLMDILYFIGG